jgi:hypothetical protein
MLQFTGTSAHKQRTAARNSAALSATVKKLQLQLYEISDVSCSWFWTPMVHAFKSVFASLSIYQDG